MPEQSRDLQAAKKLVHAQKLLMLHWRNSWYREGYTAPPSNLQGLSTVAAQQTCLSTATIARIARVLAGNYIAKLVARSLPQPPASISSATGDYFRKQGSA